jgi:hypothetical protein
MACFLLDKYDLHVLLAAGDSKEIIVSEWEGSIQFPLVRIYTLESNIWEPPFSPKDDGKGWTFGELTLLLESSFPVPHTTIMCKTPRLVFELLSGLKIWEMGIKGVCKLHWKLPNLINCAGVACDAHISSRGTDLLIGESWTILSTNEPFCHDQLFLAIFSDG